MTIHDVLNELDEVCAELGMLADEIGGEARARLRLARAEALTVADLVRSVAQPEADSAPRVLLSPGGPITVDGESSKRGAHE